MTKYISLESKEIKKTVFTKYFCGVGGWIYSSRTPEDFDKVVYLGNCYCDGDMFACYEGHTINIYKGIKGDEF
jgi:trehalose-6-phosphatase